MKKTKKDDLSPKDALERFGQMVILQRLTVKVMVKDFHGGKSVVNGPEKNVPQKVIFDN